MPSASSPGSQTITFTYDTLNRLVGITYPGQTGKATAFSYDGLSRRVSIASTPTGGGSAVTTSYLWCGTRICQSRNASNSPTRGYYDEGEFVPGSPAQPYYYGVDQLGSVRRAFASTTSAPAFSYDPYGKPLQGAAPLTDFNYAGMFFNPDSGLYLTQYRAYDPVPGRWLSRDPLGEMSPPNSSTISVPISNPLGSTLVLMDGSGTVQTSLGNGPYLAGASEATSSSNPYFAGRQNSRLFMALGQSPSVWTTELNGGLNIYEYVFGNPQTNVDTSGLGSPLTGPAWSMWTNGRTYRFFDGNGNADFDIDIPGHHSCTEWHAFTKGIRGPAIPF